jgi:hypothetical protein
MKNVPAEPWLSEAGDCVVVGMPAEPRLSEAGDCVAVGAPRPYSVLREVPPETIRSALGRWEALLSCSVCRNVQGFLGPTMNTTEIHSKEILPSIATIVAHRNDRKHGRLSCYGHIDAPGANKRNRP